MIVWVNVCYSLFIFQLNGILKFNSIIIILFINNIEDKGTVMQINGKIKYIYWQDGTYWLGYIEEYPDYMTQGENLEELQENLKDVYKELSSGNIPNVRKVAELEFKSA